VAQKNFANLARAVTGNSYAGAGHREAAERSESLLIVGVDILVILNDHELCKLNDTEHIIAPRKRSTPYLKAFL
jgi:hypothetical protein